MHHPTILVVNCNTSDEVTRAIDASAQAVAAPGTRVRTVAPEWGVSSAEGYLDSFWSAASVLDLLASWQEPIDAVVMAGFGEHGREGARELLAVPVVDITDASVHLALSIAPKYGIVTSLDRTIHQIEASLATGGVLAACAGIRATGIPVLDLESSPETIDAIVANSRVLLEQGAEAIILGCAGLSGRADSIAEQIGAPVIDPVRAGVGVADALIRLGLTTSKSLTYSPLAKSRPSWPGSAASVTTTS